MSINSEPRQPELQPLTAAAPQDGAGAELSLAPVLDMQLTLSMEIGRVRIPIRQLVGLTVGSVIELGTSVDDAFAVFVNGRVIAEGEAVVIDERIGVRFTEVVTEAQRARALD